MLHDALALLVALLCLFVIVSPRVRTGVSGSVGLGMMAMSALWSVDDAHDPYAATDWFYAGFVLMAGYVTLRVIRAAFRTRKDPARPRTDWGVLGEQEVPPRRHIGETHAAE